MSSRPRTLYNKTERILLVYNPFPSIKKRYYEKKVSTRSNRLHSGRFDALLILYRQFRLDEQASGWNKQIGNKFVNELVFFAFWIIPVYEVTALADVLVLNSIEFWSGSNPIAKGKTMIDGQDGKYLVECDGKGYTITSQNDGSVVRLDFDQTDRSWSVSAGDSDPVKFMTFVDNDHVKMIAPDGSYQLVEVSEQGLMAYRQMAVESAWACR